MSRPWSLCNLAALVAIAFVVSTASAAEKLTRITGEFDAFVIARNLESPDGLAIHPKTRELYISEETAGRISLLRDGKLVPVINGSITVSDDLPKWAFGPGRERADWLRETLVSPEGIAFAENGHLFVVEDVPSGRLLEFAPDQQNRYRNAHAIPIPWTSERYAWEGVAVARDGRIFLAGSTAEADTLYETGSVLMRDSEKDWWVIDYGPFAAFSCVGLSRDDDILIVGDEVTGGITWWDALRQREIDTVTKKLGNIEGVCTLPDGSIVVAQESPPVGGSPDGVKGGKLIRIDPTSGESTVIAEGFGTIESVILNPDTGYLYVTEDSAGLLVELRPLKTYSPNPYLLQRTMQTAEAKQGVAPKKSPQFLTDFFKELGVTLVPEDQQNAATPMRKGSERGKKEFTLEELGAHLPLIAGKVKMNESADPDDPDPVMEINFIDLFPNRITRSSDSLNPSMCFFAAKHKSGKVDRTRPLMGLMASQRQPEGGWKQLSNNSALYIPLTTCSAQSDDKGVNVVMCFLGLGIYKDYYLTIRCGKENFGSLTSDSTAGRLVSAQASIVDIGVGGEEQINVVMTGMLPKHKGGMGWLNIGKRNKWSMVLPERGPWISRWLEANVPDLVQRLRQQDKDLLLAIQNLPEEEQRAADAIRTPPPMVLNIEEGKKEPVIIEDHAAAAEEEKESQTFTNIILSKVFDIWHRQSF